MQLKISDRNKITAHTVNTHHKLDTLIIQHGPAAGVLRDDLHKSTGTYDFLEEKEAI